MKKNRGTIKKHFQTNQNFFFLRKKKHKLKQYMQSINPKFKHPILQTLEKCKSTNTLKQIHALMLTNGLTNHTYPLSKLLFFTSSISTTYAISIFNSIKNPSIFLFNTLISSFVTNNNTRLAFSLYTQIFSRRLKPNSYTFPSLFKACCCFGFQFYGKIIHTHVLKFVDQPYDRFLQASLINFYAHCSDIRACRYIFNQFDEPDLGLWNSVLKAYVGNSSGCEDVSLSLECLFLFVEMQNSMITPNEMTIVALISACTDLGVFSYGLWVHVYVIKNNLKLNCFVGTALVAMYSKCGCVDLAYQLFEELHQRDTLCYNAMIGGFALHGYGPRALELFDRMRGEGLLPDDVTLVVTMWACSHVGLVNEGLELFDSMKVVYKLEPKIEHYGCLVDLLGRAGRLKEADERVRAMPIKPNAIIWRSLLGAARVHGNIEIGEIALRSLIELEPNTSGNYVLLSNMYASIDRFDDVKRVRKLMKHQGIDKMPGSSIIEIKGVMHEFLVGDKSHPRSKEIYLKLEEVCKMVYEYGHKPSTRDVFFDIEDEEKEDALSYHSERLAMAFALIALDSSVPIRIIKNLRVCNDCHESIKLVSKIYKREIVVRDRNRFHHFKDGNCSCFDYW